MARIDISSIEVVEPSGMYNHNCHSTSFNSFRTAVSSLKGKFCV
jgi:hypothetical protein